MKSDNTQDHTQPVAGAVRYDEGWLEKIVHLRIRLLNGGKRADVVQMADKELSYLLSLVEAQHEQIKAADRLYEATREILAEIDTRLEVLSLRHWLGGEIPPLREALEAYERARGGE